MGIFEAIFDASYLVIVVGLSLTMIRRGERGSLARLFGMMGLILGLGDSFHLVPRIISIVTQDFEGNAAALGYGKMVTSITMTIFYLILYRVWEIRNNKGSQKGTRLIVGGLALVKILLSFMPQNQWGLLNGSYAWGIYRNIPFTLMGLMLVWLILKEAKERQDHTFKKIGVAVIVSFACYLPVILFVSKLPVLGALMMPKTIAYVLIIFYGYQALKANTLKAL